MFRGKTLGQRMAFGGLLFLTNGYLGMMRRFDDILPESGLLGRWIGRTLCALNLYLA